MSPEQGRQELKAVGALPGKPTPADIGDEPLEPADPFMEIIKGSPFLRDIMWERGTPEDVQKAKEGLAQVARDRGMDPANAVAEIGKAATDPANAFTHIWNALTGGPNKPSTPADIGDAPLDQEPKKEPSSPADLGDEPITPVTPKTTDQPAQPTQPVAAASR
jgi:hypothetical protein